jgi:hypothetical protein
MSGASDVRTLSHVLLEKKSSFQSLKQKSTIISQRITLYASETWNSCRNGWKVLKCGAGEGMRGSTVSIM